MAKWDGERISTVEISPYVSVQGPSGEVEARYGNRSIVKMYNDVQRLKKLIRQEGTPAIQDALDRVEPHFDYIYGGRG